MLGALGDANVDACSAGDTNDDGQITVDEILTAVNNALKGCRAPVPTATPMNTNPPTPTNPPMTAMVVVGPNGMLTFSPPDLSIHVGETVEWIWSSSAHSFQRFSEQRSGRRHRDLTHFPRTV